MAATDSLSAANKLGSGGYGDVFKGVLPSGVVCAVKRAKSVTEKSLAEFESEVRLINYIYSVLWPEK